MLDPDKKLKSHKIIHALVDTTVNFSSPVC